MGTTSLVISAPQLAASGTPYLFPWVHTLPRQPCSPGPADGQAQSRTNHCTKHTALPAPCFGPVRCLYTMNESCFLSDFLCTSTVRGQRRSEHKNKALCGKGPPPHPSANTGISLLPAPQALRAPRPALLPPQKANHPNRATLHQRVPLRLCQPWARSHTQAGGRDGPLRPQARLPQTHGHLLRVRPLLPRRGPTTSENLVSRGPWGSSTITPRRPCPFPAHGGSPQLLRASDPKAGPQDGRGHELKVVSLWAGKSLLGMWKPILRVWTTIAGHSAGRSRDWAPNRDI